MKKLLILGLLVCMHAFSYADDNSLKDIQKISEYNGTLLGYAISCDFPQPKIETVKSQFISVVDSIGLKESDYLLVKESFMTGVTNAKTKGLANTNLTCPQFQIEFDKIYDAITTGRAK